MDPSGNYWDVVMYEIGKGFKAMKNDGKTYAEMREAAYSINAAVSQFVADVINKEDPDYIEE